MVKVEISQGVYVTCELKDSGTYKILICELRRQGRLGLRIYEKINDIKEIEELIRRPRWLGKESDGVLRRALTMLRDKLGDLDCRGTNE